MNKKRETIRKPSDREPDIDWDDQDREVPPKQEKKGHPHSEEEDMIVEKYDD